MAKKKGYNKINKLLRYKKILDIVKEHYQPGYTTYAGIFRTYVLPTYPMSYKSFIDIVNMPSIDRQLEEEKQRVNKD